jgi:hypothetical protein
MQFDRLFGQAILQLHLASRGLFQLAGGCLTLRLEGDLVLTWLATGGAHQFPVAFGLFFTRIPLNALDPDLLRQTLQPVATIVGDAPLQLERCRPLRVALLGQLLNASGLTRPLFIQQVDAFVQQLELEPREIGPQGLAAGAQLLGGVGQLPVTLTIGHQRGQPLDLPLGL